MMPLHRRFDEREALVMIGNRYRRLRPILGLQVELLQADIETRIILRDHYQAGFKDWHLLSAIYNIRLNWYHAATALQPEEWCSHGTIEMANEAITCMPESPSRFTAPNIFEDALMFFELTCLKSFGFELRRQDYNRVAVRRFLGERMRFFDLDLPHDLLFGKPPGDWPDA